MASARSTTAFFVQPVLRLSALRFLIADGENSKLTRIRAGLGEGVSCVMCKHCKTSLTPLSMKNLYKSLQGDIVCV